MEMSCARNGCPKGRPRKNVPYVLVYNETGVGEKQVDLTVFSDEKAAVSS